MLRNCYDRCYGDSSMISYARAREGVLHCPTMPYLFREKRNDFVAGTGPAKVSGCSGAGRGRWSDRPPLHRPKRRSRRAARAFGTAALLRESTHVGRRAPWAGETGALFDSRIVPCALCGCLRSVLRRDPPPCSQLLAGGVCDARVSPKPLTHGMLATFPG